MIYSFPSPDNPIQQGDIFRWIPSIEFSLDEFVYINEKQEIVTKEGGWRSLIPLSPQKTIQALVEIRPVTGIVISQDCDIVRSQDITFCEIGLFKEVYKECKDTSKSNKWMNIITKHARLNQKWFYLPPDERLGFIEKMSVDFRAVTKVNRQELEDLRATLRLGRLNDIAVAHFRERIAEFFRRYPYNEWYPLNPEELAAYIQEKGSVEPYEWQTSITKKTS